MNRYGSSEGGGAARELEPDRFRLAQVDFLGAMEVDLWSRSTKKKKKKKTREEAEKAANGDVGKISSRMGIYKAQNIRRFAVTKGSS